MNTDPIQVLIVEDNPADTFLVRESLANMSRPRFELTYAQRLADAVSFLKQRRFDVVLLDLGLPDSQGLASFRALRDQAPGLPIVVLTGMPDETATVEALQAGAQDYLIKGEVTGPAMASAIRYAIYRGRAEQELKRAKEAAEAANAAKDHFIAALSHELRTPLTPVLMISQLRKQDPSLPAEVRADLEAIHRNVALEAKLIDDLLDLTRIARGKLQLKPEIVDVHEALRHALAICRGGSESEQQLEWVIEFSATRAEVWADPARLEQVFWNLLKNAMKFTPDGGRITVRTTQDGDGVRIEISDTGVGVPPEKLSNIFNAFEQGNPNVPRRFGGLGLGLTICKAIVDLHHGRIEAASEGPGRGTSFMLRLPTAAEKATPSPLPDQPPAPVTAVESAGAPILLVEDHAPTAVVLSRLFRSWGWAVESVATVREAVDRATRGNFLLVVSDLGLPDGHGHDLMRHLRDAVGLRGIAVSGYGTEDDVKRSLESGFVQHFVKPVDFEQLRVAIANLAAQLAQSGSRPIKS